MRAVRRQGSEASEGAFRRSDVGRVRQPSRLMPMDGTLPDGAQLEAMLASAGDTRALVWLELEAATLVGVARRQKVDASRLHDVAAWHLRVKRKLGVLLARTVKRGRHRSESPGGTRRGAGLPSGIDKHAARRCRLLAAVPSEHFDAYLAHAKARGQTPSTNGVLRFEASGSPADGAVRCRQSELMPKLSSDMLDALVAAMGGVDVCVGGDVERARCLSVTECRIEDLRGSVVLTACRQPADCLRTVTRLQRCGLVTQVGVVLPSEPGHDVIDLLGQNKWRLVMLTRYGGLVLVAYLGPRREAIYAACRQHGLVADVYCT